MQGVKQATSHAPAVGGQAVNRHEPEPSEPAKFAPARETYHVARVIRVVLLAASDAVALLLAASLAYLMWALPQQSQPFGLYFQIAPLALLFILGYAMADL